MWREDEWKRAFARILILSWGILWVLAQRILVETQKASDWDEIWAVKQ